MDIKFVKLHKDAVTPKRAKMNDAGYDLMAVDFYKIGPFKRVLIETGIAIEIPPGHYGRIAPRSGLAWKQGLDVMAGVIDPHFRDSIKVILINLNFDIGAFIDPIQKLTGSIMDYKVSPGDAIAQLIIEKCHDINWIETDKLSVTDRGLGGFGSSDKKN